MKNKKKQTIVVAMATALAIGAIMSPTAVYAQEDVPAAITQKSDIETEQKKEIMTKKQALPITIPQDLTGNVGQVLQDITLPNGWSWADGSAIINKEKTEYPARIIVDDTTYDFSTVDGYNAERHYVECNLTVAVTESTPQFNASNKNDGNDALKAPKAGGVEINKTNFPDPIFREYVKTTFDINYDGELSASELNIVTSIDINNISEITSVEGIKYFTNLLTLYCSNTGITELDVSYNKNLTHLYCHDNSRLTLLTVSGADALEHLNCKSTGIVSLNVDSNTRLKALECSDTEIINLTVKNNPNLTNLYCINTKIIELDVSYNTNLAYLLCSDTEITSLNVKNNTRLLTLECSNTNITELDVSNNTRLITLECTNNKKLSFLNVLGADALKYLYCYRTNIESLNVSNNTELLQLNCSNTPIEELDVTMLLNLQELFTWKTKIKYLNVSQNPNLVYLDTPQTNLGYLDWETNDLDDLFMDFSSAFDITINSDKLDITQIFKGIDLEKINIISGESLNKKSGIIQGYKAGTPIVYEYSCGTFKGVPQILTVTLNLFKSDSMIEITGNLDMNYTGKPVSNPTINKTGSKGDVIFTYEIKNGDTWEKYSTIPTNAGTYRVTALLTEDDFFNSAKATKEFTISQTANEWTDNLAITGWTYGDKAVLPTAKANFGDVIYTYSNLEKGTYTATVPTDAGTWYVKATVAGTDNYTGLETTLAFTIAPKNADQLDIPDIKSDKELENLVIKNGDKELEKGTDYDVDKKRDGNKITVIITFKDNYTGTVTKTYTEEDKKPSGNTEINKNNTVQTGDTTSDGLWTMLMVFTAGTTALLKGRKRNKKTEE